MGSEGDGAGGEVGEDEAHGRHGLRARAGREHDKIRIRADLQLINGLRGRAGRDEKIRIRADLQLIDGLRARAGRMCFVSRLSAELRASLPLGLVAGGGGGGGAKGALEDFELPQSLPAVNIQTRQAVEVLAIC